MITYDEAKAALLKIADANPDYVYANPLGDDRDPSECLYVHGDTTGCIVGKVLHDKFGVPLDELKRVEGKAAMDAMRALELQFNSEAGVLLGMAQMRQDEKAPWGAAVNYAIEYTEAPNDDDDYDDEANW